MTSAVCWASVRVKVAFGLPCLYFCRSYQVSRCISRQSHGFLDLLQNLLADTREDDLCKSPCTHVALRSEVSQCPFSVLRRFCYTWVDFRMSD